MLTVKIGDLKNQLSAYLRKVKEGVEVTISERETPIGRIVPYTPAKDLEAWAMTMPTSGFKGLSKLKFEKSSCPVDVVDFLFQERQKR